MNHQSSLRVEERDVSNASTTAKGCNTIFPESIQTLNDPSDRATIEAASKDIPEHPNAANKVTGITELLEKILIQLNFETLLIAQRVSHKFRAVILGSTQLQKKLFLLPAKSFQEVESLCMVDSNSFVTTTSTIPDLGSTPGTVVNTPLLRFLLTSANERHKRELYLNYVVYGIETHCTLRTPGSWQDMLFTQPPLEKATWRVFYKTRTPNFAPALGSEYIGDLVTSKADVGFTKARKEVMGKARGKAGYQLDWTALSFKPVNDPRVKKYGLLL